MRTDGRPSVAAVASAVASGLELGGERLEARATLDHAALRRDGRADLRAARARAEVRIGLGFRDALDRPFDAHLPPERVPVEEERRPRVRRELGALAALVAGEEDEASLVEALQQHHAHGRPSVARRGREGHRLGGAHSRRPGLLEPGGELAQRVGIDRGLVEGALAGIHRQTSVSWRNGSRLETPTPTSRSAPGRSRSARSRSEHARSPIVAASSVPAAKVVERLRMEKSP